MNMWFLLVPENIIHISSRIMITIVRKRTEYLINNYKTNESEMIILPPHKYIT